MEFTWKYGDAGSFGPLYCVGKDCQVIGSVQYTNRHFGNGTVQIGYEAFYGKDNLGMFPSDREAKKYIEERAA